MNMRVQTMSETKMRQVHSAIFKAKVDVFF